VTTRLPRSGRLATVAAALAILCSVVYLTVSAAHFSFVSDEWALLVRRPGWSPASILDPFNEQLVALPALFYKTLQAAFGMTSIRPYFLLSMLLFALAAAALYAYLRPRIGGWGAFLAILPLLFLGAAAEDLFWAFQMGLFGGLAAGLAALIALERGDRRADIAACVLLVVGLACSSVGFAFIAAAAVGLALGPRPRRGRAFVVAVPVLAYAVWYLGWGHEAHHQITMSNLEGLPGFLWNVAGGAVASLLGREADSTGSAGEPALFFKLLALALAVAVIVMVRRHGRLSRGMGVALTLALVYWVIIGLDHSPARPPVAERYQYPGALFLVLVMAELFVGVRLPRLGAIALAALVAFAVLGGITLLHREHSNWRDLGWSGRAALAGVETAGPAVIPGYFIRSQGVDASYADYREAVEKFGSPAFDEAEVLAHGLLYAELADGSLVEAEGLSLEPAGPVVGVCRRVSGNVALPPGRWQLRDPTGRAVAVAVGRFAPTGVALGEVGTRRGASLTLPRDASPRAWRLVASGPLRVCR
jgi:hypothetical protein